LSGTKNSRERALSRDAKVPTIKGLLLDLQGVLYIDGEPIAGARDAVTAIRRSGLAVRFLTNTTTRPRREIASRMASMGFDVDVSQVFTPGIAAAALLRKDGITRIHLAAEDALAEDFEGFDLAPDRPDAVVMGDLHTRFDFETLNRIFGETRNGARLIALHKNRYCRRGGEIALDLGPFVAAVEYAAGVEATLVGKPNAAFFRLALGELGCTAEDAMMVGDDPFSDIDGAAAVGMQTAQVRTGKFAAGESGATRPTVAVDSIADLPGAIGA